MADKRISQLIERTDIANNDVLPIVASGATTTNKVTVSTLQDWMQENLDVGVTSVGITLGTSGTDVNVSGSPITTSGNITINIPDASASARGVVTTGSQTFAGVKTFSNGLSLPAVGGSNQITRIVNIGTLHEGTASLNQIGFNSGNNIYFGKGLSNGGVISWNNSTVRYYTLPDADGTLALASQLDGYVTLGTAQTITGSKTFNSRIIGQDASLTGSGSADTLEVTHTSGSGIGVDISKAGNGEGLRVTKTSGSGNAVTITGGTLSAEDATFSEGINGTSANFTGNLASDTSVFAGQAFRSLHSNGVSTITGYNSIQGDANGFVVANTSKAFRINFPSNSSFTHTLPDASGTIALTSNLSAYLPLTGGTLTGAFGGTSASFTGSVGAASLSGAFATLSNYGSATSTALQLGDANNGLFRPALNSVAIATNGAAALTLASTGAATFSSSVTATQGVFNGSGSNDLLYLDAGINTDFAFKIVSGANDVLTLRRQHSTLGNLDIISYGFNGNVGIGTASPEARLDIKDASAGGSIGMFIENTAASTLNNSADIYFGTWGGSSIGGVTNARISALNVNAGNAATDLLFHTYSGSASAERMRLTSAGNVGIGTASPQDYSGFTTLHINGKSGGNGGVLRLTAFDNTSSINIYTQSGSAIFNNTVNNSSTKFLSNDVEKIAITTNGITFNGDTAAANALDDYEEGTWTPALSAAGGTGSPTYSVRNGWYTKIGRQVTITWFIEFQKNTMSGGTMVMSSFPFTLINGGGYFYPIGSILLDNLTAALSNIVFQGANGTTQGDLVSNNGTTGSHVGLPISNLGSGTINLRGTLTYFTA
jgi:hypothetical protein